MARIERFEDIRAWQEARVLAQMVYRVSGQGAFARDFGLRDQIRRAAGSVMHNIAEGFDAGSDSEFVRFLRYARRSATEVQSELYIGLDQGYTSQESFTQIYKQAMQVNKLINGFIGYLRRLSEHKLRESAGEYIASPIEKPDQSNQPTNPTNPTNLATRPTDQPTNPTNPTNQNVHSISHKTTLSGKKRRRHPGRRDSCRQGGRHTETQTTHTANEN